LSSEEAEIIRERAYSFLRNARRLFEEGDYDIAAFCIEQFCQLFVKYKLLVRTGTYPRTHSLVRLLRLLDEVTEINLLSFIDREIMFLTRLEDAYIAARYLPRRYERREVEELISFAERFREELESV